MTSTDELMVVFNEKLARTGSFDDAFKKVTWVAYLTGYADGIQTQSKASPSEELPQPSQE